MSACQRFPTGWLCDVDCSDPAHATPAPVTGETTDAGKGEHVWQAVGPNAAELWSQCANCRVNKASIEGGLPCRRAPATPDADDASTAASEDTWHCDSCGSDTHDTIVCVDVPVPAMLWISHADLAARVSAAATQARAEALREAADAWPGAQVAKRPISQWLRDRSDNLARTTP